MSKNLPSSASNNTSTTKINNKLYDIDDIDNILCPPALSPYALSILDDRLNKKGTNLKQQQTRSISDSTANSSNNNNNNNNVSKPNTVTSITSFNDLTKSSKLNNTNNTKSLTSFNTTSTSRHSKFMKKLNLGAPRRLTNEGDFQTNPTTITTTTQTNTLTANNTTKKSINSISQLRISDHQSSNIPNTSTKDRHPLKSPSNEYIKKYNEYNEDNKENILGQNDVSYDRKHALQLTPKKYSPLYKRTSTELNNGDNKDEINTIVDSPIRKRYEPHIDSPEIGRRVKTEGSPVSQLNHNLAVELFSNNKEHKILDLGDLSNNKNSKQEKHDFAQVQSILDKKKEFYLLKEEIKQYKDEILKLQQTLEKERENARIEKEKAIEKVSSTNEQNSLLDINKHKYKLFEQIGKGGSSKVYRASVIDSPHKYIAIKIVNLEDQELSTITELKGEIKILYKLRHCPRVVRLLDYSLTTSKIFFVMECGDLDLATVLSNRHLMPRFYDLEFIRYHVQEMIKCITAIHEMDVVHLDLKPANFVFVSGVLKLIDFGISNSIKGHTVNVYREYQMGTPNYMAPETLLDCAENENGSSIWKVGKPADIWSLGCIFYQLTYGTTPYASYTGTKKILAITNPSISISYPSTSVNLRKKTSTSKKITVEEEATSNLEVQVCPYLIDMIQKCLIRDPTKRITIKELANNIFINPIVVDKAVIKEVVRGCVGFGGRHPELKNVALGTINNGDAKNKEDKKGQERLDRLIDGVWKRVSGDKLG